MKPCRIDIEYVKRETPNSYYKDSVVLHLHDKDGDGRLIWSGSTVFGKFIIRVMQRQARAEVTGSDVEIHQRDLSDKDCLLRTTSSEIAHDFNLYIYRLYD